MLIPPRTAPQQVSVLVRDMFVVRGHHISFFCAFYYQRTGPESDGRGAVTGTTTSFVSAPN